MAKEEGYAKHVGRLEDGLASYAKRSFEAFSPQLLDGEDAHGHYQRLWERQGNRLKLLNRTPLQLERDRILYCDPMRKQTEKYHVLYNGQRRIVRNYTTHTMRMAQVTRSICRAMNLNADFAEAIALGSKVGAVPFVHAAKKALADWAVEKLHSIDRTQAEREGKPRPRSQATLVFGDAALPSWYTQLQSDTIRTKVDKFVPWGAGTHADNVYTSGTESYWILALNPFTCRPASSVFFPETMYGIWRHTRGIVPTENSFYHRLPVPAATSGHYEIRWDHATYEGIVVQYADDITWAIENLNDANNAALLNRAESVYSRFIDTVRADVPSTVLRSLNQNDAGGLYTFFISDFVTHSSTVLRTLGDGAVGRQALRTADRSSWIGLSREGEELLNRIVRFLYDVVFEEPRVRNRTAMLKTVAVACAQLLYDGKDEALPEVIEEKALLEKWKPDHKAEAQGLVDDEVHRIQLSLDVLAGMGDQEIYDFVGIQAL